MTTGLVPGNYTTSLETYTHMVDWLGDRDYWSLELACVEDLVHRKSDTDLSGQAKNFKTILTGLMSQWKEAFSLPTNQLEEVVTLSHNISTQLSNIVTNLTFSLPESAGLPSVDSAMLTVLVNVGLVSKWRSQKGSLQPELCTVAIQASQDSEAMFHNLQWITDSMIRGEMRIQGWSRELVLCSREMDPLPTECGQWVPYPFHWVRDGYLGRNVFYGQEVDAMAFLAQYQDTVSRTVKGLVTTIEEDIKFIIDLIYWINVIMVDVCPVT